MGETAAPGLEELRQWIGRSESAQDTITPRLERHEAHCAAAPFLDRHIFDLRRAVRHSWATQRGPALEERQDIVYCAADAVRPAAAINATVRQPQASCQRVWPCDPILLFRYSALSFNGHRIHYDYPYATEVEGYRGLIVHGPLQATLLMGLAAEAQGRTPRRFAFRGVAPLIAAGLLIAKAGPNGAALRLWIEDAGGRATMTADASW
jgi:3-methylfumaryl-CoA hydratase